VKASVGNWTVSFTVVLLLSSNAFFALILDKDNAEYFGTLVLRISTFKGATCSFSLLSISLSEVIELTGISTLAFVGGIVSDTLETIEYSFFLK